MRLKSLIVATAVSIGSGLGFVSSAAAQQTFQFGHPAGPDSHYGIAAASFGVELAKRSQGRHVVATQPNAAERDLLENAQIGTLDLIITSTGPVGNFVPDVAIVDIPFLFRDYDHARAVLDGPIGQAILKQFPGKDLIALAWGENGFRHLTNNIRPVRTPDDIRGLKVRTMENQVHMTAFRTLGVEPKPMPFTDVYAGLKQKLVDGQENPIGLIISSKFYEVQKNLSLTGHVYSPALILMSKSTYDALSAEDRKIFQEAAVVAAAAERAAVAAAEKDGLDTLRKAGMDIVTDVDKKAFQDALEPAYDEYAKKFGKNNIDRIKNYQ